MRIKLNQPYKSIATLTTDDLPDFVVLIGRNGAGKTQILAALKGGQAVIPGIGVDDIELYDMVSFRPPNAEVAKPARQQFAKVTSDAYLLAPPGERPPIEIAEDIFDQFIGNIEPTARVEERDEFAFNFRKRIRRLPDFTVYPLAGDRASPYTKALYKQVMAPLEPAESGRRRGKSPNQPINRFNGNRAALLSTAMKLAGKLPHELTHDDIMRASYYEGDTLTNSISEVFAAYKVDQYIWAHKQIEIESGSFQKLMDEYRTKYTPPWITLREILSEMRVAAGDDGLFDFEFSDPEEYGKHPAKAASQAAGSRCRRGLG